MHTNTIGIFSFKKWFNCPFRSIGLYPKSNNLVGNYRTCDTKLCFLTKVYFFFSMAIIEKETTFSL